ncbi:amidase [Pseudaminobacter salicylatoxidans]|uniref:amidase n=1 Tax=Pseudaminobacter salicylatoxidans TaxID=93369 RepID=UPI00031F033E|nr:amidase [Pseudaminobacter salicylatoxidans]
MPTADDLHYLDLADLAALLRSGALSSIEVTEAQLARISASHLNAYIEVTADLARKQALQADARRKEGDNLPALHGVPIALKDIFDLAGVATTAGMTFRRGTVASTTSTAVQRLVEAGAVVLGKLNVAEGVYADHKPAFGAPVNAWDANRYAGASSSGSGVAVAAGLCYAAPSSDTGGSIRLPSGANSVTGLKPTWGRVSRHGAFALAPTLDHIGVIARSAVDTGLVLQVMAGADPNDPTASQIPVPSFAPDSFRTDLRGTRIGLDEVWISRNVDPQVTATVLAAVDVLVGLGATVRQVAFPDPEQIILDWFELCGVQAAFEHRNDFPARRGAYGQAFSSVLDLGHRTSVLDYHERILRRQEFSGRVQALFEEIDLLAVPVYACLVPTLAQMAGIDDAMISMLHRFTCSFTMSANPTITLPGGFATDGSPIAVQLVGRHFAERDLVEAGSLFQRQTDWHRRRPPAQA